MANIATFLQKILDAVYGEEVRGSIHDALAAMNVESSNAMEYAATAKDSAKASAAEAKKHETGAGKKADEAAASAGAAKTSETNAKASETTAIQKASEAMTAAAGAKASEAEAANSAATATQKALDAAGSQAAAAQSAAEAKVSKETAATIKSDVEKMGAQVKTDKDEADAANQEAQAAKEAAVSSAETSSENALTALNAKTAAETAKTAAEAAKTAAENARTATETAAENAERDADDASQAAAEAAASALSAQQYSGKPPKPQDGTWWIWDVGQKKYIDTGIGCELVGPQGIGIEDIVLTSGDHTPGTSDVYTIKLTDGTSKTISVYNGRNGTGAGDVLGIAFDLVLPASGWVDGVITISDNRFLASAKYKYFVGAWETSKEEYLNCGVETKDVTTNGAITFINKKDPTADLTVNVLRLELGANGA